MATLNWQFSEKQQKAFSVLYDWDNKNILELLYGGAKGGGKSVWLCRFFYLFACQFIEKMDFPVKEFPLALGFIGRVRASDFQRTTFETWKRFIDAPYTVNEQKREIVISERVKYFYGGLDDQETINKFNSAEYCIVGIDQAEEMEQTDWATLRATLRLKYGGFSLPKRMLLTANPAKCFLKDEYVSVKEGRLPSKMFLQALPSDNPFLDSSYTETLKESYKNYPELLNAYLYGSWDELEGGRQVIRQDWVLAAVDRNIVYHAPRVLVVCDPAWTGENADEQVIYTFKNGELIEQIHLYKKSTWELAARIYDRMKFYFASIGVVDAIGIGAGVHDDLVRLVGEDRVFKFISSEKPTEEPGERIKHEYGNLRAEAWFRAAEMFANGEVSIPNDSELIKELTEVKYEIKRGKIYIEDKNEIRGRLGRSPDRADCFVMGLWALAKCPTSYISERNITEPLTENERKSVSSWEVATSGQV